MKFEIDNGSLKFSTRVILRGIYLGAETGKITGILGSNGTGKSSLLKVFFGSLQPQDKLVRINNHPHLPPLFTSGLVTYLPQHSLVPKSMKIRKAFKFYKTDWKGFTGIFPEMEKYRNSRMGRLSGGEARVVEIYLSLKSPSHLVLLDEPFSHLAPVLVERITPVILREKEKKAIIITDQLYHPVIALADDLYLLKNGCSGLVTDLKDLENYNYLNPKTL